MYVPLGHDASSVVDEKGETRMQTFETAFLPVSVTAVFDRFGQPYNATRVLDPSGSALDPTAYAEYSPIYMPIAFVVAYGAQFMLLVGLLVNTLLLHGKEVWERFRRRPTSEDVDVHVELMQEYPEVPDWAYLALLLVAFGLSAALVSASSELTRAVLSSSDRSVLAGLADGSACMGAGHRGRSRAPLLCTVRLRLCEDIDFGTLLHFCARCPRLILLLSLQVSINFLAEMLVGFLVPGKPLANIVGRRLHHVSTLAHADVSDSSSNCTAPILPASDFTSPK